MVFCLAVVFKRNFNVCCSANVSSLTSHANKSSRYLEKVGRSRI